MADNWPLHSFLELGALPGAVPSARLHARHLLWEWGQTKLTDSAELVVTELLTNAVKASQPMEWPQPVRLWLCSDRTRLLVLVWDANPHPPVRIDADDHAESGRGLLLVEAISEQRNWYLTHETGGKVVWSLITP
jgi:anti-sigma regulatory factor (Ser/Thr protein kinase)